MRTSSSITLGTLTRTSTADLVRHDASHADVERREVGCNAPIEAWQAPIDAAAQRDADLQRRVRSFLATRSEPALRRIDIDADCGRVTLRGLVRSFYERQLAVHCCRRVAGVTEVIDQINVQRAHGA